MRKFLLIAVGLAIVAAPAMGQTVVGSKHDLSSTGGTTFRSNNIVQVCVFCHTPHQPDTPSIFDVDPLWNHTLSTIANYDVYDSVTLNANPQDVGGGTTVTNLCLSCHDGTIGLGSLLNDPNNGGQPSNFGTMISGNALLGTNLSNDHPVNFTYDAGLVAEDGGLNAPPAALLFGGTVQCASCHDPHDPTFTPFLVQTNVQSALCLVCHIK